MMRQATQVPCEDCGKSLDKHLANTSLRTWTNLVYLCFECYHDIYNPEWRYIRDDQQKI